MSAPNAGERGSAAGSAQSATVSTGTAVQAAATSSAALGRFQAWLDAMFLPARVEEQGALAILVPMAPTTPPPVTSALALDHEVPAATVQPLTPSPAHSTQAPLSLDASTRRAVVQAALAAGYSHVALEIPLPPLPSPVDAPLSGGHPA